MTDFRALLADLRRPQLLIRAARCGLADYRRERDLRRLIDANTTPDRAVTRLLSEEERLETTRRAGEASYAVEAAETLVITQPGDGFLNYVRGSWRPRPAVKPAPSSAEAALQIARMREEMPQPPMPDQPVREARAQSPR